MVPFHLASLLATLAAATTVAPAPLVRSPDLAGERVVFVHSGDIWTAALAGGPATRLTDDDGSERRPRFSPDGARVAFTAEYDGNPDVYVMGSDGSHVERLTFHPGADEVVGWHPRGDAVLFASERAGWGEATRLYLVPVEGGPARALPLAEAARGALSPDGQRLVYTRVAVDQATWKHYRGGQAEDLWLHDLASGADRRLTDHPAADRLPLWLGERVVFSSDRDGRLALYTLDPASGATALLAAHPGEDILEPAGDGRRVVYQAAGSLWWLDPATGERHAIPLDIATEPLSSRPYRLAVDDQVSEVACAPEGGRAALVARGEVFTVPRRHGPTRNLTRSSGAHDSDAAFSPDGSLVAFVSDASGEDQIWLAAASGLTPAERLTDLPPGHRHTLRWSPDGRHVAFSDHRLALNLLEVAGRTVVEVDRAEHEPMDLPFTAKPISDAAWSPDGQWLAYSKIGPDLVSSIWLYSLAAGRTSRVDSGPYNDREPAFSADGEHLFFISQRHFDPTFCDLEWAMVFKHLDGIFALTLRRDGEALLAPRSDESAPADDPGDPGLEPQEKVAAAPVAIDLDGLGRRVEALPLPAGNYRRLRAADDCLLVLTADTGDFNRMELREPPLLDLAAYLLDADELVTLAEGVRSFDLAADGRHAAWLGDEAAGIVEVPRAGSRLAASGGAATGDDEAPGAALDLTGLTVLLDPRAEWQAVFAESWRLYRDLFYDPALCGVDFDALGRRLAALAARAASRDDLTWVVGELVGELGTSHSYVYGSDDRRRASEVAVGLLGADLEPDEASGRYRFATILRTADWSNGVVPPLARPGVAVSEGDFLLAVDRRQVTTARDVFAAFAGLTDTQVVLTVASRADGQDARQVVVEPIADDRPLRYLHWVEANRRRVEEASGGRLGYLHLPDTFDAAATELGRSWYSQTTREGLIVDGRANGGGLDPDPFLERLARRPQAYWTRRQSTDQVTPMYSTRAHLVCLTDRNAGSGGDELAFQFRQRGLGPIVGTRSWGGLVGVSTAYELVDGSAVTVPEYRIYSTAGEWVVENQGVTPDIEVELDQRARLAGRDSQLEMAIEVLLARLAAAPQPAAARPPFPPGPA